MGNEQKAIKACRPTADIIRRFWAKVNRTPTCWLWTASTVSGYGQVCLPRIHGKQPTPIYAHRFAWMLAHGDIPEGLQVLHKCDVPRCVRPSHLFLGTQADNLKDAVQKGRLVLGIGCRKLSEEAYREILTTDARGIDLAAKYGTSETTISRIRHGQQGVHLRTRVLANLVRVKSRQVQIRGEVA